MEHVIRFHVLRDGEKAIVTSNEWNCQRIIPYNQYYSDLCKVAKQLANQKGISATVEITETIKIQTNV